MFKIKIWMAFEGEMADINKLVFDCNKMLLMELTINLIMLQMIPFPNGLI